jgi:hypothetical protein
MTGRTEEQKIVQSPLKLTLGDQEYDVKPLVIRDSRKWREKLAKTLGMLPKYTGITTDTPDKFKEALDAMLVSMPDQVVDLVFDYAKDLNRDEVESIATDAEIAAAFEQIVEVAFPLARSMVGAMTKLSQ